MRLFVLVRHGQSELNATRRVNGDPAVPVGLTPQGEAEAGGLALQVAGLELDLCVHTRFGRTRATAEIALDGRGVPCEVEPLLDDIDVGELEGRTIDDYRAWKTAHTRADAVPGGESLDDAARRYATAFERLLARPERTHPRRLPRDPGPLRDQRGGGLGRRSTARRTRSATASRTSSTRQGSPAQPPHHPKR